MPFSATSESVHTTHFLLLGKWLILTVLYDQINRLWSFKSLYGHSFHHFQNDVWSFLLNTLWLFYSNWKMQSPDKYASYCREQQKPVLHTDHAYRSTGLVLFTCMLKMVLTYFVMERMWCLHSMPLRFFSLSLNSDISLCRRGLQAFCKWYSFGILPITDQNA